jgi:hypothetical protein
MIVSLWLCIKRSIYRRTNHEVQGDRRRAVCDNTFNVSGETVEMHKATASKTNVELVHTHRLLACDTTLLLCVARESHKRGDGAGGVEGVCNATTDGPTSN